MTRNNPNPDLVDINVYTKFGQILSMDSSVSRYWVETKLNDRNYGITELRNHETTEGRGKSSIAPLFKAGL